MGWLRRAEQREVWEIDDHGSFDDIKAASMREICKSAAGSAERVAVFYFGPNDKTKRREHLADGCDIAL